MKNVKDESLSMWQRLSKELLSLIKKWSAKENYLLNIVACFLLAVLLDFLILVCYSLFPCVSFFDRLASGEVLGGLLITIPTIATWVNEADQKRKIDALNNFKMSVASFSKEYSEWLTSIDFFKNNVGNKRNKRNHTLDLQLSRIKLIAFLAKENRLTEEAKKNNFKYDNIIDFVSLYLLMQTYILDRLSNNIEAKLWRKEIFNSILKNVTNKEKSEELQSLYYTGEKITISCIDFSNFNEGTRALLSLATSRQTSIIFKYCYFSNDSLKNLIELNEELLDDDDCSRIIMESCELDTGFKEEFNSERGQFPVKIKYYYIDGTLTKEIWKGSGSNE